MSWPRASASTRQGKKHPDTAVEKALADPEKHFNLLVEQFKVPGQGRAAAGVGHRGAGEAQGNPPYEPATRTWRRTHRNIEVPDAELEALGKERAKAIQDALLWTGRSSRGACSSSMPRRKADSGDKVKVELAVK